MQKGRKTRIFAEMKKAALCFCVTILAAILPGRAYNDHRGHNLDSLERVVARWTPEKVDRASDKELLPLNRACRDLMLGYQHLNGEKTLFYARKAKEISDSRGWRAASADAARYIGQYFYGKEQCDSALFYFKESLALIDLMENGATSVTNPDGYSEREIDDNRSALYGAIGNLYNVMDSIPKAMEYYAMAGEIFDKYGWNESNSVLYLNIGSTWLDEEDYKASIQAYQKSLEYAKASGDSLMVSNALSGIGEWHHRKGHVFRALHYYKEADKYFSKHQDIEFRTRLENMDAVSDLMQKQKRIFVYLLLCMVGLVVLVVVFTALYRKGHRKKGFLPESEASLGDEKLNDRELAILRLMAAGKTSSAIAEEIFLSPETVKWYRKRLFAKFNVSNAPELIRKATEDHLI